MREDFDGAASPTEHYSTVVRSTCTEIAPLVLVARRLRVRAVGIGCVREYSREGVRCDRVTHSRIVAKI